MGPFSPRSESCHSSYLTKPEEDGTGSPHSDSLPAPVGAAMSQWSVVMGRGVRRGQRSGTKVWHSFRNDPDVRFRADFY